MNQATLARSTNVVPIKKEPESTDADLVAALRDVFDPFLTENFVRLAAYSMIQVAYDKGQKLLSQLITQTFQSRFPNVRLTKVLPIHSRIFQVADFICTLKRMSYRLESTGTLSKSELKFFGTLSNFQRNWLSPFAKLEWK